MAWPGMKQIKLLWVLLLSCLILPQAQAQALDTVTLQLKWKHQFQFAGYYMALEKGYYQDAGLDVRIKEFNPDIDVINEVLSGHAQFGIGMSDLLLSFQQKPVALLAVIFQHSPLILLARADQVSSIHDLANKTIMNEPQAAELQAYLKQEGLKTEQLHIIPHNGTPLELIQKKVAAVSAYSSTEPFILKQAGLNTIKFSPRASGIDFYGDNLFTSAQELKNHPERSQAFLHASLQGWEYAMAHPEEAIQLILNKYNSQKLNHDFLAYEAEETSRLMRADLVEIGHINPGRWRHIGDTYADLGLLPRDYTLKGFFPDKRKEIIPAWVTPTALGGGLLLCLLAWLTVRSVKLSHRLQGEIRGHQHAIDRLQESETKYRLLAENSSDVIWLLDLASQRFTYVSPSVEKLRGMTAEEIMAEPMDRAITPESLARVRTVMTDSLTRLAAGDASARHATVEIDQPCKDGSIKPTEVVTTYIFDATGKPVTVLGITRDISERKVAERKQKDFHDQLENQLAEIRELQTRLQEQAIRDSLTGLYNRRYLDETLPRELARAKREGYPLALIMVDLDHFKRVNDTFGHAAGDDVLRSLANILRKGAREGDITCRYGGEEFIVVLPHMSMDHAFERATDWCKTLAESHILHGQLEIHATLSAGISAFPQQGADIESLLKHADEALYQAKNSGRNQVVICQECHP